VMNIELEAMALAMPEVDGHPNRLPFHGVLTLVGVASRRAPKGARRHRVMLTRKATEAALPSLLGMALDYAPALDAHDQRRKIGVITEAEIVPLGDPVSSFKFRVSRGSDTHMSQKKGHVGITSPTPPKEGGMRHPACGLKCARHFNKEAVHGAAESVPLQSTGAQVAVSGFLYAHDFSDVVAELRAGSDTLGMSYEITDATVVSPESPIWTVTSFTFTGAAVLRKESAAYPETWMEIGN